LKNVIVDGNVTAFLHPVMKAVDKRGRNENVG
jgi:hypothetical protein